MSQETAPGRSGGFWGESKKMPGALGARKGGKKYPEKDGSHQKDAGANVKELPLASSGDNPRTD